MTDPNLTQHPIGACFPAMTDEAFADLRADIAANGLRQDITLHNGAVLDGWHRQRSCVETGTTARYETFDGDDDAARRFVVSINLMRRHLDTSQRAMIAGRFATMAHGTNQHTGGERNSALLVDEAAALVNVGKDAVKDARVVLASGDAAVIADVEAGKVSVSKAAKTIRANTPKATTAPKPAPVTPPPPLFVAPSEDAPPPVEIGTRTIEQWEQLSAHQRDAHLQHRNPKATLNRQKAGEDENAIDWAKWTWNPITGCLHTCPYCYARDIAERFAGTSGFPNGFVPTFCPERLAAPINGTPRATDDPRDKRIFTGSMADMFGRWVPPEWINAVLDVERNSPQWDFLMLTKFPKRMAEFNLPQNAWVGTTVDCQARVANAETAFARINAKVRWLSVEPMIEPITFKHLDRFDLLVIGGASPSNNTPQWIPPFAWIDDLMRQADDAGCAVFLKSNLYRKEEPGGKRYRFADRAPDVFHYLARASDPDQQVAA